MARTPSTMLGLGTRGPRFPAPRHHRRRQGGGAGRLRAPPRRCWWPSSATTAPSSSTWPASWPPCPGTYPAQGVAMVAIYSNDVAAYPDDSPEAMAEEAARQGWAFPYLYDETQAVAPGLPGRLHARLLPLRRRPQAGLPGPARRQPARQRRAGHRRRPAGRRRRRAGRPAGRRGPAPEPRLQHQVEARQRAGLRLSYPRPRRPQAA